MKKLLVFIGMIIGLIISLYIYWVLMVWSCRFVVWVGTHGRLVW